jgi:hypothetical protein
VRKNIVLILSATGGPKPKKVERLLPEDEIPIHRNSQDGRIPQVEI